MVRLFDPAAAEVTIASDQLSVTDASHGWVVLGDDLATFVVRDGRGELASLESAALDVLVRLAAPPAPGVWMRHDTSCP